MVTKLNVIGLLAILSIGLNNIDARFNKHLTSDETTAIGEDSAELGWHEQATQFGERHRWKISTALAGAVAFLEARTIKRQTAEIAALRAQLAPYLPPIEPAAQAPAQPARPALPPHHRWTPHGPQQTPAPQHTAMEDIDDDEEPQLPTPQSFTPPLARTPSYPTPVKAFSPVHSCPDCRCTR